MIFARQGSAGEASNVAPKTMKITVSAQLMKITPEIATEWLADRWKEQRTVRNGHLRRLVADMEAGRFKISPDAILRIKGKLANGQHRLEAVAMTGKAQTFLVMESNDEELYKVIDAGLRRTVSDGLIGVPFAASIPSIGRWVQAYETKTLRPGARTGSEAGMSGTHVPTQCELIDYCEGNEDLLVEAAKFVHPFYEQTRLLPMSIGGAVYALASARDGRLENAKAFIRQVYVDGGNTAAGDLRNRLISNRGSKARLKPGYIFGITLKAFKAFCNGTRPGALKWANDEQFPAI